MSNVHEALKAAIKSLTDSLPDWECEHGFKQNECNNLSCEVRQHYEAIKLCKAALVEKERCEPVFTNTNHGFVMTDRNFTYAGNGYIQDNNFDHDAALKISGDFAEGDLDKYAQMIVKQLNTKG